MYRYLIDIHDYEDSNSTIFLHEKKFTQTEFDSMMKESLEQGIKESLESINFVAYSDKEIESDCVEMYNLVEPDDYSNQYYLCDLTFSDCIDTHVEYVIKYLIEKFGFVLEQLPSIQASYHMNNYTHIKDNMNELYSKTIIENAIKQNAVPIKYPERLIELNDKLEHESVTSNEIALELIRNSRIKNN